MKCPGVGSGNVAELLVLEPAGVADLVQSTRARSRERRARGVDKAEVGIGDPAPKGAISGSWSSWPGKSGSADRSTTR